MPTLRQLAAATQNQNARERIKAAIWQIAEQRLRATRPETMTEDQWTKVQTFARAASRFADNWVALFAVPVLQAAGLQTYFIQLTADSNLLSAEQEAALDTALLAAADAVFDGFADMPN